MPDTEYGPGDEVRTVLGPTAVCVAHTDGLVEIARDEEGADKMPDDELRSIMEELFLEARKEGAAVSAPHKFAAACATLGYGNFGDDVTVMLFGSRWLRDGLHSEVVAMNAESIDAAARNIEQWGEQRGWDVGLSTRVQLVFEEKLMNMLEHGFDYRQRLRESVSVRLRDKAGEVEMTVWDCGRPPPSLSVAAGSTDVAFDLANQNMSGGGRGRLMMRELCEGGIERMRYGVLNETVYHIPKTDGTEQANECQCDGKDEQ